MFVIIQIQRIGADKIKKSHFASESVPPDANLETDVQVGTDVQAGAEEIYHEALKAMDMDSTDSEESDVDSQFEFDFMADED